MPTPRPLSSPHDAEQTLDLRGRQRGGRLVHDQDARRRGQRLGDRDELALADAQLRHRPRRIDATPAAAQPLPRLAQHAPAVEHPQRRQLRCPRNRFAATSRPGTRSSSWKIVAIPAACASRGLANRTGAPSIASPPVGHHAPERMPISVLLPAPFSPRQRMDLAGAQIEIDAAQRMYAAEMFLHPAHPQQRLAHRIAGASEVTTQRQPTE